MERNYPEIIISDEGVTWLDNCLLYTSSRSETAQATVYQKHSSLLSRKAKYRG